MTGTVIELRVREELERFTLDVDLRLEAGAVGVFGPSGSGKTTLLEHVTGWRRGGDARLSVGGRTLRDGREFVAPERRGIGYVPQDVLLFPHRDVRGNVEAGLARAEGRRDDLEAALDVLELRPLADRGVADLSGGERQRVALARALASAPSLLVLDEPLGALDLPLRRRILPYLLRVRERFSLPMLFVSHDPTEVLALCDTVVRLEAGRAVELGPAAETLRGPELGSASFENVLGGRVVGSVGGTAEVELPGGARFRIPGAGLEERDAALFALRADDILLSAEPVRGLSARNCIRARIDGVHERGGTSLLLVRPGPDPDAAPALSVSLTPEARAELGLERGGEVVLIVKTHACHPLS